VFWKTPYKWGGNSYLGIDCSHLLYKSLKDAGENISYRVARDMARGSDGWKNRRVSRDAAGPGTLVWYTFSDKRPNGHVSVYYGNNRILHAGSRGVIIQELKGLLVRAITLLARLLILGG